MKTKLGWLMVSLVLTVSCGGDAACVPGEQIACACAGGESGAQACNADGSSYETCSCDDTQGGVDAGLGLDACDVYAQVVNEKVDDCDLEVSGGASEGGAPPCTDKVEEQAKCLTPCLEDVSCSTLLGDDPAGAEAYLNCLKECV